MTGDFSLPGVWRAGSRLQLEGAAASARTWLDGRVRALALERGAVEWHFPASVHRDTLARAGYFESFPDGAASIGPPPAEFFLSPAVCYHAYAQLAGRRLAAPLLLTASQTCFREADRGADTASRLWEFTMREIMFIGPEDWVAAERRHWTAAASELAAALRLDASVVPAADPFFGMAARGRRLMQQLKQLKDELRVPVGGEAAALASFNTHETFFGGRFDITLEDGRPAHSGCAAFGLERWALAVCARHGEQAAEMLQT